MTMIASSHVTYSAYGVREDLSDIIKNVSPMDTFFYSSLSEGGATQPKVEWQTDALDAIAANKQLEGDTEAASATNYTARVYNMCQIQRKIFAITNTMDASKSAGNANTVDYQTALNSKALARDVEYAFLQEVRADGNSTTARSMRGILNWTTTNLDKASDATLNGDGTVTGGTSRALTKNILDNTLQLIFASGGQPKQGYLGAWQKAKITSFSLATGFQTQVLDRKWVNAVDVYVSDFGTVSFQAHRGMPTTQIIILDPNHKGKKATLRNTHREQLAKAGDGQTWVVRVEHSLRDLDELAHGRITTLSVS